MTAVNSQQDVESIRADTFVDGSLEGSLREVGYVVIDLLEPSQLDVLTEITERLYIDDKHGFHASNLSAQHGYRHSVYEEVGPIIDAAARALFVDHHPFTASLLMKWPDEDSAFNSHQDWTMVDETRFRTVNVWCPLVDTSSHNGALRVLPGSHKVLDAIRCSPMPPAGCESPGWQVGWEEMVPVEVKAGQALVFDHSLLHSSGPNFSDSVRPAVAVAFKPKQASLYHWFLPNPSERTLEVMSVDSAFFADVNIGSRPDYPVDHLDEFAWSDLTKQDLLERCAVGDRPDRTPDAQATIASCEMARPSLRQRLRKLMGR
ncbi:MAG: phytanoyl-CoA dioxygenase family protein [Microthrixaceae bacterium]